MTATTTTRREYRRIPLLEPAQARAVEGAMRKGWRWGAAWGFAMGFAAGFLFFAVELGILRGLVS